jgi:RNA polymerase sigma-70 factor (ECF subfamily)
MSIAAVPSGEAHKALEQEFEALYREHCQLVYRTAFAITSNRQDAEDVLQSIFLKLLQREFPADLGRNPRAYLHRAAVNLSLNVLRSRRRQKKMDGVEEVATPGPAAIASDAGLENERHQRLLDAMTDLKPKATEILLLHYKHNFSDAEIAKMLGKSRGTIAVTLYRIRARLKKLMEKTS